MSDAAETVRKATAFEEELAAISKEIDITDPLTDVKESLSKLIADLALLRRDMQTSMTALEPLPAWPEISALRREIDEHAGHSIARARECGVHLGLASAATAKLIEVIANQVRGHVAAKAAQAKMRPASAYLRLRVEEPGLPERLLAFDNDPVVKIGGLVTSHVCLRDENVSRLHAVLERKQDGWYVIDLGSAAGTVLNAKRISKAMLMVDDVMLLGGTTITVLT